MAKADDKSRPKTPLEELTAAERDELTELVARYELRGVPRSRWFKFGWPGQYDGLVRAYRWVEQQARTSMPGFVPEPAQKASSPATKPEIEPASLPPAESMIEGRKHISKTRVSKQQRVITLIFKERLNGPVPNVGPLADQVLRDWPSACDKLGIKRFEPDPRTIDRHILRAVRAMLIALICKRCEPHEPL